MDQNQEPERDKLEGGDLHVKHGKAWHWFDNFWYHYKWQTIIAAIGLFAVIVCILSTCRRTEPEYYFYYAGSGEFSGAEQRAIVSSLSKASGTDGDSADVSISFLFYMTEDQVARFREEHAGDGLTISGSQIGQNRDLLRDEILAGNAIIFFMDPEVLADEQARSTEGAFLPVRDLAPAGTPDEAFSGEYGIYLDYTVFRDDPAFAVFPEGTVVAIRNYVSALSLFQRDKALETHAKYEELFKKWLTIE